MAKTQVTLTKHYPPSGNGPNAFLTADGTRFKAWPDNPVSSLLAQNLNKLVEIEYHIEENGQYVNNMVDSAVVLAASSSEPTEPYREEPSIRGVDRGGGIARAIEFLSVAGESVMLAYDDGSLFDLADAFAEYSAFGTRPGAAAPSSAAAGVEGGA